MTPAWLATFVRRWHCHPDLCHTVDPIGWHSSRMAILALHFWPDCSRDLLVACLCHDLGESVTGDIPAPAKRAHDICDILAEIEGEAIFAMGMGFSLSLADMHRMRYLDRLDAYLWAKHHAPHVMTQYDWRKSLAWLQAEADTLNIKDAPI
jgi:hypothetical protein